MFAIEGCVRRFVRSKEWQNAGWTPSVIVWSPEVAAGATIVSFGFLERARFVSSGRRPTSGSCDTSTKLAQALISPGNFHAISFASIRLFLVRGIGWP